MPRAPKPCKYQHILHLDLKIIATISVPRATKPCKYKQILHLDLKIISRISMPRAPKPCKYKHILRLDLKIITTISVSRAPKPCKYKHILHSSAPRLHTTVGTSTMPAHGSYIFNHLVVMDWMSKAAAPKSPQLDMASIRVLSAYLKRTHWTLRAHLAPRTLLAVPISPRTRAASFVNICIVL